MSSIRTKAEEKKEENIRYNNVQGAQVNNNRFENITNLHINAPIIISESKQDFSLEPQPLSEEKQQEIKQNLYKRYRQQALMVEIGHEKQPVAIDEKTFINLALVAESEQKNKESQARDRLRQSSEEKSEEKKEEAPDSQRGRLLNSWELIHQVQEPISIQEIWSAHKNDTVLPKRIVIEGEAGIGKTTLCGYIVHQWSEGKLWNDRFDWVVWISLRNLLNEAFYRRDKEYQLGDIVLAECFGCVQEKEKQVYTTEEQRGLKSHLAANAEKVLYLLDGYDEIAGYEKRIPHLALIVQELLASPQVVLTTRPRVAQDVWRGQEAVRRVVTLGFTDEDIPRYVDHYFSHFGNVIKEEKTGSPLVNYLKENPDIWGISHTPVHLSLICLAWSTHQGRNANPFHGSLTLTELYQHIVELLLQRYLEKQGVSEEERKFGHVYGHEKSKKILPFLEDLALRGMSQYDIVLEQKLIEASLEETKQEPSIVGQLVDSGLIKPVTNREGPPSYTFLHLTFQEFFAARYVANHLQANGLIPYVQENKYVPRFAVMWWFVAGLLKEASYK